MDEELAAGSGLSEWLGAAENMDWGQVVMNGGPPCFHLDEEYGGFQCRIAANPELGALIRGGGGIRKVRVAVGSRGKSGGSDSETSFAARQSRQRGVRQ